MRILVTGGVGYIGSVLISELLKAGYEVTVVDSFLYGQKSFLDLLRYPLLQIVEGDVRDRALIKRLLNCVDAVLPLAGLVGAPICDEKPDEACQVNLDAIEMLLELRSQEQWILFPTTNSGYGIGREGIACTEETPLRPISLYGRLKVQAEQTLLERNNTLTLRLATVFGASLRMRWDLLVNYFVYQALIQKPLMLYQGHFKRNYIHIRDVAGAFLHSLEHFSDMKGEPYNVGLEEANLSKRELCLEIQKEIPGFIFRESAKGSDPDQRNYIVSNRKIEQTGFKPSISLQETHAADAVTS
jgi:nucleoside-diphosphate-sugar epimerase